MHDTVSLAPPRGGGRRRRRRAGAAGRSAAGAGGRPRRRPPPAPASPSPPTWNASGGQNTVNGVHRGLGTLVGCCRVAALQAAKLLEQPPTGFTATSACPDVDSCHLRVSCTVRVVPVWVVRMPARYRAGQESNPPPLGPQVGGHRQLVGQRRAAHLVALVQDHPQPVHLFSKFEQAVCRAPQYGHGTLVPNDDTEELSRRV